MGDFPSNPARQWGNGSAMWAESLYEGSQLRRGGYSTRLEVADPSEMWCMTRAKHTSAAPSQAAFHIGKRVRMYCFTLSGESRSLLGPLRTKKSPPSFSSVSFHLRKTGSGLL